MELIFLGTSSMVPTKQRNHPSVALLHEGKVMLFDCGEGTQRQMKIAGLRLSQVSHIFVTHWHGDHVLGIPGLLQSICASEPERKVTVVGPQGTKKHMKSVLDAFPFEGDLAVDVSEVGADFSLKASNFTIEALEVDHGVKTVGYRVIQQDSRVINMKEGKKMGLKEGPMIGKIQAGQSVTVKGKKILPDSVSKIKKGKIFAYVTDTLPTDSCAALAANADVFVCESTYGNRLLAKAEEYHHMTATQAAEIAREAGAKTLYLTHFSARYKDTSELEREAQEHFPNTRVAEDFLKVKL